ncbi:uncharacterized protein N7458_002469 [Penicillium daleae]|uniref:Uncharacterized protein n=1 Tax=Penicillium daleae TaxID=63821 RepID=A0AAD6CD40_9EURO|nr:uncharacterized protein N7458_002469 [Penicillium daleae]KAJ5460917.1 hypothetical protein N7458_002469 [Penicillium daleae]
MEGESKEELELVISDRWNKQKDEDTKPPELDGYIWHVADIISHQHVERKLICFQCEKISFRTKDGELIWWTSGSGDILLPRNVKVVIEKGTYRVM